MRSYKKILLVFCLVMCEVITFPSLNIKAQAITWQRVYGEKYDDDDANSVQQTFDGGYILAGKKENSKNSGNVFLIKTDYLGNVEWEKSIGDSAIEEGAKSIKQTSDSGYIITAYKANTFYSTLLVKTDKSGNVIWTKVFSYDNHDSYIKSIKITIDGGYIMCGDVSFISPPGRKAYIIRTDIKGNLLWQNVYSDSTFTIVNDIVQNQSGNFYFTGYTFNSGGIKSYIILDKISSDGMFLDHKTFEMKNSNDLNSGRSLILESLNRIVISGQFDSAISNITVNFLIKSDTNGNQIWQKSYWPFAGLNRMAKCINGDYVLGGTVGQPDYNLAVLRIDKYGNKLFQKLIPTLPDEVNYGNAISMTNDNGAILVGFTTINGIFDYTNIVAVKIDSLGNAPVGINPINSIVPLKYTLFQNYPNPFNFSTKLKVDFNESGNAEIYLFNIQGKLIGEIFNGFVNVGTYSFLIDMSEFSQNATSGIYFVRVNQNNVRSNIKIVFLK